MVLLHGFTDTWRTWDLVRPQLEAEHDVLAITLPGHTGGPELSDDAVLDDLIAGVESAMDEAGFETAHIVGNSLGGYLALHLAARGRAKTVVALAPAGGWAAGDPTANETLQHFLTVDQLVKAAEPHIDAVIATPEGRRMATAAISVNYEHFTPEQVEGLMRGAAGCMVVTQLVDYITEAGWTLDAERITCPVRVVWGTDDQLLKWPGAAARFRDDWLPNADWVVLDHVGHCIQLDVPTEAAQLILGFTGN
jgi:pimeloyl-ACP methyl ester carboxylesterase